MKSNMILTFKSIRFEFEPQKIKIVSLQSTFIKVKIQNQSNQPFSAFISAVGTDKKRGISSCHPSYLTGSIKRLFTHQ